MHILLAYLAGLVTVPILAVIWFIVTALRGCWTIH